MMLLVIIYLNLSANQQQQTREFLLNTVEVIVMGIKEIKYQGNHSTLATDETYCPTDQYPYQQYQYQPYQNEYYR